MILDPVDSKPYQQPEAKSIYQLVKSRAEKNPEAVAITAPGRAPLTYGRLFSQVESAVEALRAFGVNRNDRVATVLPNGPEMAVAFVAVSAGATCAPLNPSYRASELDFAMSDLNARALVVWSGLDSPARQVARRRRIRIVELAPSLEAEAGIFELTGEKQTSSRGGGF